MADLTANRITNDADIIKTQIQQKTDNGMKAIRPETDTDIVINKSTIDGNTVTDVLDNTLPITAGQNISITPSASGVEIAFTGSLAPNVSVKATNPITVSSSVTDTAATYTVGVKDASTGQKGVVQLSDSISLESNTMAATSKAVKAAYDLANGKQAAFDDGFATIATVNSGTITIKPGVSQSGGKISNSSGDDVSTYTAAQIDSLVAGLTKYLGTATAAENLTGASTANAGDFFRVTASFTVSGWGTAHTGDLVILKKDAVAGDYATITNWEIIHTGDNTSYGIVNKTTDGLAPKWDNYDSTKIVGANYVLMNNGSNVKWRHLPDTAFSDNNTTYTLSSGDTAANVVKLTSSSGDEQTVTINNVAHASSADQVANSLTIKLNSGTTEGTNLFTYNGSAAKSVNITASGIGAAASSHTHGNITNGGALQTNDITIANGDKLVVTDSSDSGKVARSSVGFNGSTTYMALTPKGAWNYFAQYINSGVKADGTTPIKSAELNDSTLSTMTLGDSGVTPGVYCALQVNSKGIVTAGAHVIKMYKKDATIGPELVTGGFAFIEI